MVMNGLKLAVNILVNKGENMFVLVKDKLPLIELDECDLILQLQPDGKTFKILRNKNGIIDQTCHNSMLKHFILSVSPYPKEEENEEADRVPGG